MGDHNTRLGLRVGSCGAHHASPDHQRGRRRRIRKWRENKCIKRFYYVRVHLCMYVCMRVTIFYHKEFVCDSAAPSDLDKSNPALTAFFHTSSPALRVFSQTK